MREALASEIRNALRYVRANWLVAKVLASYIGLYTLYKLFGADRIRTRIDRTHERNAQRVLDGILEAYVEGNRSPHDIVADGFPAEAVAKVVRLIKLSEYKRRQSAVGMRLDEVSRAVRRDIDGILGQDLLREFRSVTIDFDAKEVRLTP